MNTTYGGTAHLLKVTFSGTIEEFSHLPEQLSSYTQAEKVQRIVVSLIMDQLDLTLLDDKACIAFYAQAVVVNEIGKDAFSYQFTPIQFTVYSGSPKESLPLISKKITVLTPSSFTAPDCPKSHRSSEG